MGRLIAVLLLLAGAVLACSRGGERGEPALRYVDWVAGEAGLGGQGGGARRSCADQSAFMRAFRPGEESVFEVSLGREGRLVVEACAATANGGALAVEIRDGASGEIRSRESLAFEEAAGWRRREADLAGWEGRVIRVGLRWTAPSGGRLYVREASVRHRLEEPTTGDWSQGPRILLVSLDTLRADAVLGPSGEVELPALRALAADGEVFARHYASSTWTLPSHASLLTGYPPPVHRVGLGRDSIGSWVPTLAERMRGEGLATGALVFDCEWLGPHRGFARGFDSYRSEPFSGGQQTRAAVNWISEHRTKPFFFFLHYFDAHSDGARLPYEGKGVDRHTVAAATGYTNYGCREGRCASKLLRALLEGDIDPLPGEDEILDRLYRAGVAETDAAVGRLLEDLRELGLYDDMTIVVTSDHGESLLEHGDTLHANPWEEVLRVPLVIKWAGGQRAGVKTSTLTSALDVVPTLLRLAGGGSVDLPGADLRQREEQEDIVTSTQWWTIHRGRWKGVFRGLERDAPASLFDLARDPGEKEDLAGSRADLLERLRRRTVRVARGYRETRRELEAGALGGATSEPVVVDEQQRRRLEALGYVH